MKRWLCMILTLSLLLSLAACGGNSSSGSKSTAENTQEETLTPKEAAEKTDQTVSVLATVTLASMEQLIEYISGFGTVYTADNMIAYAKTGMSDCYQYLDGLEDLPDQENSEAYVAAAEDFMNCVCASWILTRDFFEDGDQSALTNLENNVVGYNILWAEYQAARIAYLTEAGFTEEEANSIVGIAEASAE